MEHKLSKDEIAYFYELLYKYEYDSHGGYQDKKVKSLICDDLVLDDNHKDGENICSKKRTSYNSLHSVKLIVGQSLITQEMLLLMATFNL